MAYERKETYTLEKVFAHVYSAKECRANPELEKHVFDGDEIKMTSGRYKTFKYTGHVCKKCGLVGKYFAKERHKTRTSEKYHFNLYGIHKHGYEVMLTKDHIKPKAEGGRDTLMNYQTMCVKCNGRKSDDWNGLSGC